ncbi:MAG: DNA mismatch repair endonuclease MutL [Muribaculaceae bacterium]
MSDVIKLLPDSVANQIAAGEVIQRPASVIKELVENAVDAGGTNIQIIIKDAGRTLIQVIDNGCGMSATDARLAFERHSTSKITEAADLFTLHTMGFRGEALASICAVAQVELVTMRKGETIGTRICISGSKLESQEAYATIPGSNFKVKNLFFNVPARRKFLKKDSVELSNIVREFERLALVNPGIGLELIHNDTMVHQLLPGSLKYRITSLFGKSLDKQLISIDVETPVVKINGFVGLPANARRRGALQYLFVNGRNMRHPYFAKAVLTCYEKLIANDVQPNYFLNFTVDPSTIDVNIHPTKNEIKFENEQAIWQILMAAVREALGKSNAVPSIDFDVDDSPEIPVFNPNANAKVTEELSGGYNPFDSAPKYNGGNSNYTSRPSSINNGLRRATANWESLYDNFNNATTPSSLNTNIDTADTGSLPQMHVEAEDNTAEDSIFQLKNKYIISPAASGLMIIDQHRAHILILYNKYMEAQKHGGFSTQQVIFPEIITLSPSQNVIMESIEPNLKEIGFDISFLGDNSWTVNGYPSVLDGASPNEVLLKMIDNVSDGGDVTDEDIKMQTALAMAKAAAIPSGKVMSVQEMKHLMTELLTLPSPGFTPTGLPIIQIISTDEISDRFTR